MHGGSIPTKPIDLTLKTQVELGRPDTALSWEQLPYSRHLSPTFKHKTVKHERRNLDDFPERYKNI